MSYFDIKKLSKKTGYSVNTLYKKVAILTLGEHYFKPNNGKLIFDDKAVDFLVKGESNGKGVHKGKESVCLDHLFA